MKQIIRLKIDVTKLDKTAFFKGKQGTYADLTYFYDDEPNQYGKNGGIKQDLGKDRRGEETPFIGDGTIVPGSQKGETTKAAPPQRQRQQAPPLAATNDALDEDPDSIIPF
jgi:hypothetical protein